MNKSKKRTQVDRIYDAMNGVDPKSKEYQALVTTLNELQKSDTALIAEGIKALTSITGILAVLNFERTGAVISKAFGLIKK